MLKKIYTCDCFLDTACYRLEIDDDFINFQKKCFRERERERENTKTSLLFVIGQKEHALNFPQQSLLFAAKHLLTFR